MSIIGNIEYKSIREKAYINGTQENIMQLAAELDKAGISYSGRVSDYRSAITVEASDRARTLEILKGILNTGKENIPAENSEKNIIGNAEYKYIPNKRYVRGETEAMLRTADRLTAENISFSGRIKGDTVTLTVSGDEAQELAKKYFAEEKNRIENIQSAYFLALSSDTFEDGYYISEVNVNTGEEIDQHRSQFGDISMFISVDSAVRYAEGVNITLSNTDEQLNEWRRIEIEAEAEKDRQLNLSRSREIIKRLPMTSENDYEEHFVLRENSVDWIYFNPDGANGEGQFVQTSLYADDLIAAYNARSSTEDYRKYGQGEFIETIQNGSQTVINADTEEFERLADIFIKSRSNKNVIVSAPIVSGNGYDNNFERIINLLENHFEDVRNYKENHITEASENITVEGHMGTWYVIDSEEIEGKKLFLLEHEEYGDEAANIIIDENKNLVMESVYNGFDDYRDSLEYDDDKQFVSRDFAVELWENGFTVFMNDRNNALSNNSDDLSIFELFTEEKNNTFYAFSKDIVQQRLLDDIVTLLDDLDSAARFEAVEQGKEVGNVADYARDMYEDGECAYEWRDGLTEWQHISASIRSGNTEYIYAWLRDLQLELPYLKDNRNFSITEAINNLDNYEKQYMGKLSIDELKKGTRLVYNNTNWEVTHVNNNVLALKNLDSDSQMSSTIIERWQNVVTRSKVEFIAEKENSPMGKYVPDENLPLSKQLYDLAKMELTNYENSLDTAEKAKAAAYELSVKRDILSYIEYDLAEDITDPDVENACRQLISTGYPLDTFYQDWLKNEYDNRMEAIRMTAEDTFRKENERNNTLTKENSKEYDIDKALQLDENPIVFSVVSINSGDDIVVGEYIDDENVRHMEEYMTAVSETNLDTLDVQVHFYTIGSIDNDNESIEADEAQIKYISEHLNEVLPQATLLESELYNVKITDKEIENSDRIIPEKNLEFTVITFEDGSVYTEVGRIDDDNVNGTAAYADMMKNNFDVDKMEDLDESIKVEYAVYHTGDGEAVMPTEEELAEIRNNLDDYIEDKDPVSTEDSYLHPWKNVDDILYGLEELWKERHNTDPHISDDFDRASYLLPENLSPAGQSGTKIFYETYSSVKQIKLKGSEWLDPVDATVEMNRRGVDLDDIEMLNVEIIDYRGQYAQKDITPEQFAVYEKRIDNNDRLYDNILNNYKRTLLSSLESIKEGDVLLIAADKKNPNEMTDRYGVVEDKSEFRIEIGIYSMDDTAFCSKSGSINSGLLSFAREYNFNYVGNVEQMRQADYEQNKDIYEAFKNHNIVRVEKNDEKQISNIHIENARKRKIENLRIEFNEIETEDITKGYVLKGDTEKEKDVILASYGEISPEHMRRWLVLDNYTVTGIEKADRERIEAARETAHKNGIPFSEKPFDPENPDEFNPYAWDGSMSDEDFHKMRLLNDLANITNTHDDMPYRLIEAFKNTAVSDWQNDLQNTQNIKYALLNILNNEFLLTEKVFTAISESEYIKRIMREDSFEIYQVKSGEEYRDKRFTELSALDSAPNIADYDLVYSGKFSELGIINENKDVILNNIYSNFNIYTHENFTGHSLSISDIIVLHKNGEDTAHYVDDIGFKDVPEFLTEKTREQLHMLSVGDIITLADRHGVWKVSAVTDIQIEFENTDPNSPEKSFSHIDFGQRREHLQETLQYTLVSEREESRTDKAANSPVGTDEIPNKIVFEMFGGGSMYFRDEQMNDLAEISADGIKYYAELSENDKKKVVDKASELFNIKEIRQLVPEETKSVEIQKETSLKTVTSQYNSYLIVQDVVYALKDLLNGIAENYDWKNYAEAFNKVLDSNVNTNVALPLYKSGADDILLAAAEKKVISADDIAKALSNLELVLQNSHLLKNPEEKVEQISFFSNTPSRTSSDEIGFYSSASDPPQNDKKDSPVGNNETLKNEKSFAEQVDEVLNGTADRYSDLKVCDTPQILLDVGCEQLPMFYTKKHLRDALKPKGYTGESIHYHGLDKEQIKRIPDLLADPVMIYDSLSSSRSDSIVVVTSELDKDNLPVIAAIRPNGKAKYDLEIIDSNFVLSIHGREHFDNQLARAFNEDKILYLNKNKSQELFSVLGLQLSEGLNNLDSDTIIHQSKNIVNTQKQKNHDYTITDKNYGTEGGAKTRFVNNVAAIKLLKIIEKENRTATPEEQEVLAKYVGWGGIANAFDSRKPDWNKEYNELKSLLTDEEYRAARASTMNAHYTSPVVINAIYSGLENLGFKGGKILEPAMGIGNFFGAMPDSIRNNSNLHGVELDSITGRIAQQLYPSANVQVKGYEDTGFENGSFDVAVGNVPFGGYKLNDKDYNKQNFLIHDYFFAKTLDKVRAGGIVAFVTSKGTLDKESPEVRKYLAERAELLGAIRLPNNAFKENAGTEVTSDIIFLQKRERPISIEENPPEWVYKDMLPNGIAVNKYFADHPEMILGEMVEGNKLYGNQTDASMCVPIEGADLEEQLAAAIKNITGEYKAAEKEIAENSPVGTDEIPCPPNAPKYSFIVQDDVLYYHKSSDTMEKYKAPDKSIEKIKAMAQLRDSVHKLLDLQLDNTNGRFDTAISEAQAALNRQYDDFSEKYGLISNSENKMLFRNDNSYHLIKSLEKLDKDGNFIGKADIFSKITINPKIAVDHCDNAQDALILSLSEKMCVNLEYMSILTGKSEEELIAELGDKIYQNPQKFMRWESADEYLTGNIRSKLAAAEAAGLTRNAEALRAVMPERIEAADIAVKLGSAWIDPDYVRQFIIETLKPDFVTSKNIEVTYMPATDRWKVDGYQSAYSNTLANETYGTYDMDAYEIIEATLNMQRAEIKQRVKDEHGNDLRDSKGRYVYEVNQQKTTIVQSKQDELKRMFSDWIFADPDRREKLVDVYNEKFNSIRLREYDGSHLNFVGMSSAVTLKEHQRNAVARGLYSNGNTLLAHEVGAGKTYEMITIAMEGKRLGLHNKSLITAPNGLTEQWGNAFRTLYPNANVLVATEKDFQKENRRDLFAKIATGDWDAVVIGHSQFDMIHLSRERELDVLHSELDILEKALREIDDGGKKSFSVKQIEKSIRMYEDKIEKLLAKAPEDDMLCFEKLGIDKIFVDESQAYKNLDTPTKMRNVSGIGSGGSGRSMQLLMKCKYLDEVTGGKGTVFASGTPISNSMSEMYTLMRYLQADKLAELGINSFDRWASIFGETVSSMELSPEGNGKYQMKTRFAKFQNLPELMNIFKECADIKTAESLDLDRPDFEMHNVNVPATAIQAMMIKELGERAKEIRAGHVDPTEDNMCKLTVDGRKIGLDQRCMNPNLPDDPKSKVNVCINNVFDIWQKTAAEKSTQLIFCDLATPQPTLNENTYTVFRKNEKGGYSDVYTAKLGERDTAEKIMKKLNGKKPPKNYEAGDVSNGDIIMLKRVNYEEETAYNTAFEVVDGKLTEITPETWEKLKHTPVEEFESERRFCVYDDIKQKLIAKGVPEKEIAFIHDVDKAEEKQKLYDKMNKGEIRVLIGSTFKCGAGMNAQERMIALHDLDAPMRPSDMEQRHGRIIRQGNTNSKVDIYRYTTDKTFDAYLYQMLENKQRFISQIMTDKSPVRSCEDVDEVALDYAEVKALCAGNPLIREKIDLETDITKLNVLKSAFLSQKYSLQDKAYKSLPEHRGYTERHIEKLKADIETVKAVKPLINEDNKNYYPVIVNGKEYHNKEEAGQAIREAVVSNDDIMHGRERVIGSYRGLKMSIHLEGTTVNVNLEGATSHYGELNLNKDVKASGNIVRLDNVINGMELELQKQEDRLQSLNADIEEAKIAAEAPFPQEQELTEKEKRLAEVNTLLADTEVQVDNSMELYAALVEICPELESYDNLSCKYEKGENSGIEPLIVEKFGDTVFIAHTYVQNGDLMYDPAIEFSFDIQSHRAQALSYQLSGLGIYQDFRDGNLPDQKADVEEMALGVMFENIKAYGYERTKFNAEDNREAEKEIRDDSAR